MPYKNIERRRKCNREAMRRARAKEKEQKEKYIHGIDKESYNNMIHSMEKDD